MSMNMKNILLAKYSAKKLEAYSYSYVYNWVLYYYCRQELATQKGQRHKKKFRGVS